MPHYIYHLLGKKVGCTKDLDRRLKAYTSRHAKLITVLEILHDATDQEAGDREQYWNKHFGYGGQQLVHYTQTLAAAERGFGIHCLTFAQRSANGRKSGRIGGRRVAELGIGVHALTTEQRAENGSKGGKAANEKRVQCPHCGIETNPGNLGRYHGDRCQHRPIR